MNGERTLETLIWAKISWHFFVRKEHSFQRDFTLNFCCRKHVFLLVHVSTALVLHNEQVMVGYLVGQKRCLRALPIYWLVRNLSSCFIWFSEICGLVQNSFDEMLSMFTSLVHLCILGKFLASSVRWFSVNIVSVKSARAMWKVLMVQNCDIDILEGLAVANPSQIQNPLFLSWRDWEL
jgi:hypothetical protein